ncbi:MAG: zinc-dependent metalloprotease, partial [Bacteroidota bacterium]
SFLIATKEYGIQTNVMTRQVGGVHYNRAYAGQGATVKPLEPVSEVKQKEAMKALAKYAFASDVWAEAIPTFNYLLDQRRGFDHFSKNDDPKIHDRVLDMQSECLNHLMHPRVHQRIIDSYLYGNTYSIDEVMFDLTQAIFESALKGEVNTVRQNLQIEYTRRLIAMLDEKNKYDNVSQGVALSELKRIQKMEAGNIAGSSLTKAHRAHVVDLIDNALSAK